VVLTDLLDISRLDTGAWPVSPSSFALAPLIQRLADEYSAQAHRFGLDLHAVPSSATIRTDRQLLERIVRNFISNAIRYTETGRILLGCRNRGAAVAIEVWDTGIGIPRDRLDRIFEEFHQLGAGPERPDRGLGLGLAIVQRIARLLALEVEVDSRIGHGSRFAVLVPRAEPCAAPGESDPGLLPVPSRDFASYLVLCIDDDPATRDAMAELLGSWRCELVTVATLEEALAALARAGRAPDLIVADYHLQEGALGTEVIAALHGRFGSAIPALLVSSNRTAAMRALVKAHGLSFLAKPIPPARLRALMSYLLGGDQAAQL